MWCAIHTISLFCYAKDSLKSVLIRRRMCILRISNEILMVPLVGIELTTYRLQGGCSTN